MRVCKRLNNFHGRAILLCRSSQPHAAIDVYTEILDDFDILSLLEQLSLLYDKNEPSFMTRLLPPEEKEEDDEIRAFRNNENSNTFAL